MPCGVVGWPWQVRLPAFGCIAQLGKRCSALLPQLLFSLCCDSAMRRKRIRLGRKSVSVLASAVLYPAQAPGPFDVVILDLMHQSSRRDFRRTCHDGRPGVHLAEGRVAHDLSARDGD